MPLPGSRVIPPGWEAHHRPVAEQTMTATGRLQRPTAAGRTFDETGGKSGYPDPEVLWRGPLRVQRLARRGGALEVGDRALEIQLYQVSIPISAPEPRANDQIVVESSNDPAAAGKTLRVLEVRLGSLTFERDLTCQETTPTSR